MFLDANLSCTNWVPAAHQNTCIGTNNYWSIGQGMNRGWLTHWLQRMKWLWSWDEGSSAKEQGTSCVASGMLRELVSIWSFEVLFSSFMSALSSIEGLLISCPLTCGFGRGFAASNRCAGSAEPVFLGLIVIHPGQILASCSFIRQYFSCCCQRYCWLLSSKGK